jgi:hypothetical protein
MTPDIIKAFTDIAGPWAVVGILLLFAFLWIRRDDKSVRASLESQVKYFEAVNSALGRLETSFATHNSEVMDMKRTVELNNSKLVDLTSAISRIRDVVPLVESIVRQGAA